MPFCDKKKCFFEGLVTTLVKNRKVDHLIIPAGEKVGERFCVYLLMCSVYIYMLLITLVELLVTQCTA